MMIARMLLLMLAFWQTALAGSFVVSSTTIRLSKQQPIQTFSISNTDNKPVTLHLQIREWEQEKQKNVFSEANDLVLVPPIFTLKPGQKQLVRMFWRNKINNTEELTYRLFVREILSKEFSPGVQRIALELSIPVFIKPQVTVEDKLMWSSQRDADTYQIVLQNDSNITQLITGFEFKNKFLKEKNKNVSLLTYVLPKKQYIWSFNAEELRDFSLSTVMVDLNGAKETLAFNR